MAGQPLIKYNYMKNMAVPNRLIIFLFKAGLIYV